MALAVVNYPTVSETDFEWIQGVRRQYDPLYFNVVAPHFTVVFPTDSIDKQTLARHVRRHVESLEGFEVVLRCVVLADASFQDHAHACLVPDEGLSAIVRLHDRLYTGALAKELRLDLPFFPRIGVANAPTAEECKQIVDDLNSRDFEIRASFDQVDVVGFDGNRVWSIDRST